MKPNRREFVAGVVSAAASLAIGPRLLAAPTPTPGLEWEPPLPPGALRRYGSTRMRIPGGSASIYGIHLDNRWLILEPREDVIQTWSLDTGRMITSFPYDRTNRIHGFVQGEQWVTVGLDPTNHITAVFQELLTGKITKQVSCWMSLLPEGFYQKQDSVIVARRAVMVFARYESMMSCFDPVRERYRWVARLPEKISDWEVSSNGEHAVIGTEKQLFFYGSDGLRRTIPCPKEKPFRTRILSQDGRWLLATVDQRVWFCDTMTGESDFIETPRLATNRSIEYEELLTPGLYWMQFDRQLNIILDMNTKKARTLEFGGLPLTPSIVSRDGKLAFTGDNEGIIGIWDLETGEAMPSSAMPAGSLYTRNSPDRPECVFQVSSGGIRGDFSYLLRKDRQPLQLLETESRRFSRTIQSTELTLVCNDSNRSVTWRKSIRLDT
jgi:hypothetical protein